MDKRYSILINDNVYFVNLIEKKIKNIRIKIDNNTIFIIGYKINKDKADQVINKNKNWIIKKINLYNEKQQVFDINSLINFKSIYIFGSSYNILDLNETYIINNKIYRKNKLFDRDLELKKIRLDYLPFLKERFIYWSKIFNINSKLIFKDMKSKYGYCKYKENIICLSNRLIHLPELVIDYVIVHEFCHFKVHNHSRDFYLEVFKYFNNYKEAMKLLKYYSIVCQ